MLTIFRRSNKRKVRGSNVISQDEFFTKQLQWLYRVSGGLLIEGYDRAFMERDSTAEAIRRLVNRDQPARISAILPEGLETIVEVQLFDYLSIAEGLISEHARKFRENGAKLRNGRS